MLKTNSTGTPIEGAAALVTGGDRGRTWHYQAAAGGMIAPDPRRAPTVRAWEL
jgi:hypothetical protein